MLYVCSFMMEYDVHTILDGLTLLATLWVIYIVRFQLYETYQPEQDSIHDVYVVSHCKVHLKELAWRPAGFFSAICQMMHDSSVAHLAM